MKIYEVLDFDDHKTLLDVLKSNDVVTVDKLYDYITDITSDFQLPSEFMNNEIKYEILEAAIQLSVNLKTIFEPNDIWCVKIQKIIDYLK